MALGYRAATNNAPWRQLPQAVLASAGRLRRGSPSCPRPEQWREQLQLAEHSSHSVKADGAAVVVGTTLVGLLKFSRKTHGKI